MQSQAVLFAGASMLLALLTGALPGGASRAADPPAPAEVVLVEPGTDGIQRATIQMDSYSYAPNHLVVQVGKPVELTLTSVTILVPHNFILNDPAAGLRVEEDVGAGKTTTVRFTPAQAGTFTFYCDKKLLFFRSHREKGMEGRLEVR